MADLTIPPKKPLTVPPKKPEQGENPIYKGRQLPENKRNFVNEAEALGHLYHEALENTVSSDDKKATEFQKKKSKFFRKTFNNQYKNYFEKYHMDPNLIWLEDKITDQDVQLDDPNAPELPEGMPAWQFSVMKDQIVGGGAGPENDFTLDKGVAGFPGLGTEDPTGRINPEMLAPPLFGEKQTIDDYYDFGTGEDLISGGSGDDQLIAATDATNKMKLIDEVLGNPEGVPKDKTAVDPTDPLGIRLFNAAKTLGRFDQAISRDIYNTIPELPRVAGGLIDAANATLNTMDELAYWLNENVYNFDELAKAANKQVGFEMFKSGAQAKA